MNAPERLSVVVVTRDEAHQIRECLEGLRFADEIVLVDMHSTDNTVELARPLADKVILHDGGPQRLIHVNKNVGIEAASGPWILSVDADERLTPALRDEILGVVRAPGAEMAAYSLPFTHYFFGKYLRHGGFRNRLVRLFRKGRCRYAEDRAHSAPSVDGAVGELHNLVVHFNHRRISDFVRKMNLYTSSDAALMAANGRGGLRNRPVPERLGWKLVQAPLGVFWNRYVRHLGCLDGVHGLVAAALMGFYQFVEYAKLWELKNVREDSSEAPS